MRKRSAQLKLVVWLVITSFLCQNFAFAVEIKPYPLSEERNDLQWAQSVLPKLTGSEAVLEDAFREPKSTKTIIHIQDAHTNYSGQINTAKTLEKILEKSPIKYIFLEAGSGDESLSFLRKYSDSNERRRAADKFLRDARLQGTEYLDLTSSHDFVLWGVEDMTLYAKSVALYREVTEERGKFEEYLDRVETRIEWLKSKIYNPLLKEFDEQHKKFLKEEIPLTQHYQLLVKTAKQSSIDLSYFPNLKNLNKLQSLESQIDFKKANEEMRQAVTQFSELENTALESASKFSAQPHETRTGFFHLFEETLGDKTSGFPELEKYFRYLKVAESLNLPEVIEESDKLETEIYRYLAASPDEAQLVSASRNVRFLKKMLSLTLTPEEFERYSAAEEDFNIVRITGFLNAKIMEARDHYENVTFLEEGYEEIVRRCEDFYRLTLARDQKFIENLKQKMDAENQAKAILITGGYHSPNIKSLLKDAGISYISITPRVYHQTNQKRYESLLLRQNIDHPMKPSVSVSPAVSHNMPERYLRLVAAGIEDPATLAGEIVKFREDRQTAVEEIRIAAARFALGAQINELSSMVEREERQLALLAPNRQNFETFLSLHIDDFEANVANWLKPPLVAAAEQLREFQAIDLLTLSELESGIRQFLWEVRERTLKPYINDPAALAGMSAQGLSPEQIVSAAESLLETLHQDKFSVTGSRFTDDTKWLVAIQEANEYLTPLIASLQQNLQVDPTVDEEAIAGLYSMTRGISEIGHITPQVIQALRDFFSTRPAGAYFSDPHLTDLFKLAGSRFATTDDSMGWDEKVTLKDALLAVSRGLDSEYALREQRGNKSEIFYFTPMDSDSFSPEEMRAIRTLAEKYGIQIVTEVDYLNGTIRIDLERDSKPSLGFLTDLVRQQYKDKRVLKDRTVKIQGQWINFWSFYTPRNYAVRQTSAGQKTHVFPSKNALLDENDDRSVVSLFDGLISGIGEILEGLPERPIDKPHDSVTITIKNLKGQPVETTFTSSRTHFSEAVSFVENNLEAGAEEYTVTVSRKQHQRGSKSYRMVVDIRAAARFADDEGWKEAEKKAQSFSSQLITRRVALGAIGTLWAGAVLYFFRHEFESEQSYLERRAREGYESLLQNFEKISAANDKTKLLTAPQLSELKKIIESLASSELTLQIDANYLEALTVTKEGALRINPSMLEGMPQHIFESILLHEAVHKLSEQVENRRFVESAYESLPNSRNAVLQEWRNRDLVKRSAYVLTRDEVTAYLFQIEYLKVLGHTRLRDEFANLATQSQNAPTQLAANMLSDIISTDGDIDHDGLIRFVFAGNPSLHINNLHKILLRIYIYEKRYVGTSPFQWRDWSYDQTEYENWFLGIYKEMSQKTPPASSHGTRFAEEGSSAWSKISRWVTYALIPVLVNGQTPPEVTRPLTGKPVSDIARIQTETQSESQSGVLDTRFEPEHFQDENIFNPVIADERGVDRLSQLNQIASQASNRPDKARQLIRYLQLTRHKNIPVEFGWIASSAAMPTQRPMKVKKNSNVITLASEGREDRPEYRMDLVSGDISYRASVKSEPVVLKAGTSEHARAVDFIHRVIIHILESVRDRQDNPVVERILTGLIDYLNETWFDTEVSQDFSIELSGITIVREGNTLSVQDSFGHYTLHTDTLLFDAEVQGRVVTGDDGSENPSRYLGFFSYMLYDLGRIKDLLPEGQDKQKIEATISLLKEILSGQIDIETEIIPEGYTTGRFTQIKAYDHFPIIAIHINTHSGSGTVSYAVNTKSHVVSDVSYGGLHLASRQENPAAYYGTLLGLIREVTSARDAWSGVNEDNYNGLESIRQTLADEIVVIRVQTGDTVIALGDIGFQISRGDMTRTLMIYGDLNAVHTHGATTDQFAAATAPAPFIQQIFWWDETLESLLGSWPEGSTEHQTFQQIYNAFHQTVGERHNYGGMIPYTGVWPNGLFNGIIHYSNLPIVSVRVNTHSGSGTDYFDINFVTKVVTRYNVVGGNTYEGKKIRVIEEQKAEYNPAAYNGMLESMIFQTTRLRNAFEPGSVEFQGIQTLLFRLESAFSGRAPEVLYGFEIFDLAHRDSTFIIERLNDSITSFSAVSRYEKVQNDTFSLSNRTIEHEGTTLAPGDQGYTAALLRLRDQAFQTLQRVPEGLEYRRDRTHLQFVMDSLDSAIADAPDEFIPETEFRIQGRSSSGGQTFYAVRQGDIISTTYYGAPDVNQRTEFSVDLETGVVSQFAVSGEIIEELATDEAGYLETLSELRSSVNAVLYNYLYTSGAEQQIANLLEAIERIDALAEEVEGTDAELVFTVQNAADAEGWRDTITREIGIVRIRSVETSTTWERPSYYFNFFDGNLVRTVYEAPNSAVTYSYQLGEDGYEDAFVAFIAEVDSFKDVPGVTEQQRINLESLLTALRSYSGARFTLGTERPALSQNEIRDLEIFTLKLWDAQTKAVEEGKFFALFTAQFLGSFRVEAVKGRAGSIALTLRGSEEALVTIDNAKERLEALRRSVSEEDLTEWTPADVMSAIKIGAQNAVIAMPRADIRVPEAFEIPLSHFKGIKADTVEGRNKLNAQMDLVVAQMILSHDRLAKQGKPLSLYFSGVEALDESQAAVVVTFIEKISKQHPYIHLGSAKDFRGIVIKAVDTEAPAEFLSKNEIQIPVGGIQEDALLGWVKFFEMADSTAVIFAKGLDTEMKAIDFGAITANDVPDSINRFYASHLEKTSPELAEELTKDVLLRIFTGKADRKEMTRFRFWLPLAEKLPINALIQGARIVLKALGSAA